MNFFCGFSSEFARDFTVNFKGISQAIARRIASVLSGLLLLFFVVFDVCETEKKVFFFSHKHIHPNMMAQGRTFANASTQRFVKTN